MDFRNNIGLATYIDELGGDLWLVGGAVRDMYMIKRPTDFDYVITGVDIKDIPFKKIVGSDFPVFLVEFQYKTYEVALARTEKKDGVGYHGFKFHTDKSITIEQDLHRRDFTMNAMASHVLTGSFVDPYNGRKDIVEKNIKHVSDAFSEDPTRVYRAARFAAQFSFYIDPSTLFLMESLKSEMKDIKVEKVWKELEKVLKTDQPSTFFKYLMAANILNVHFPQVEALDVPDMHDGTAFNHTMTVMDHGKTPMERWGLLCHDFGKGVTTPENHPHHHKHDKLGRHEVQTLCYKLKIPNKYEVFGDICSAEHMKFKNADTMRPGKFLRWILKLEKLNCLSELFSVSIIDSRYREGGNIDDTFEVFYPVSEKAFMVHEAAQEVTGKTLIEQGYGPVMGPTFGEILFQKRVEKYMELIS